MGVNEFRWPSLLLARLFHLFPTQAWYSERLDLYAAEAFKHVQMIARQQQSLAHWIDQAIRARAERDTAEAALTAATQDLAHKDAVLAQALADKDEAVTRILYLEGETRDLERSRDELGDIADGFRAQLLAVKAKRKGSRR